jgi:hypothetical protein
MKKGKGGGGSRKKLPNAGVRQMAANLQAGIQNAKNRAALKEAATEAAKAQQTAAAATAQLAALQGLQVDAASGGTETVQASSTITETPSTVSSGDAAPAGHVDSMQVEDTMTAACTSECNSCQKLQRTCTGCQFKALNAGMPEVLKTPRMTGALPKNDEWHSRSILHDLGTTCLRYSCR